MANSTSADVVVIGSGVCGAMVAHQAVQAGLSVLMLEAGPRGERSDYWQRFMNLPAVPGADSAPLLVLWAIGTLVTMLLVDRADAETAPALPGGTPLPNRAVETTRMTVPLRTRRRWWR